MSDRPKTLRHRLQKDNGRLSAAAVLASKLRGTNYFFAVFFAVFFAAGFFAAVFVVFFAAVFVVFFGAMNPSKS